MKIVINKDYRKLLQKDEFDFDINDVRFTIHIAFDFILKYNKCIHCYLTFKDSSDKVIFFLKSKDERNNTIETIFPYLGFDKKLNKKSLVIKFIDCNKKELKENFYFNTYDNNEQIESRLMTKYVRCKLFSYNNINIEKD